MDNTRIERDSLGEIEVPANRYWGAQTERSRRYFRIGADLMPLAVVHALAAVKHAAATANEATGALDAAKAQAIRTAAEHVLTGALDDEFPLAVFQTGSGTQTNANVNEVLANWANEHLGSDLHPSDDVNMSQSTNDTFVTAMYVAAYRSTTAASLPALSRLRDEIAAKAEAWAQVAKVGRTHLMDATPLTVGQEWSGYAAALTASVEDLEQRAAGLTEVALGGTAVGTGVNTPRGYRGAAVEALAEQTGLPLRPASNPFAAQASLDPLARAHSALRGAATVLFKIANDVRWAASGPRAGLAELRIPANEPGSTIMPGKVNPTQAEALLQVCIAVIGNDTTMALAAAEGNFELNAFRPVAIDTYLRSSTLLADAAASFAEHLVAGTELNEARLAQNVANSVMAVTALSPLIGYEAAARVAKTAIDEDLSLRDALTRHGHDPALADDLTATARGS